MDYYEFQGLAGFSQRVARIKQNASCCFGNSLFSTKGLKKMNILRLPSVEEIKKYSSLNGYFEVWNKFYTTCPDCGEPVPLDSKVTRIDLHKDETKRVKFCGDDCCAKAK